jgi:hypothetical protein
LDTYLELAARILKVERRPLSPQAILTTAYRRGIVPPHLHGRTQHKTLQARISEDIVERREHSLFFRTAPGRFFLREFLPDATIAEELRRPFPARRRFRELVRGPALAIEYEALQSIGLQNNPIRPENIFELLKTERYCYEDPRKKQKNIVFIRSFVCVCRGDDVLSYRVGRYRDDRDSFMSRRSIGFYTFVHFDEHTLFNFGEFGILDAGVRAAKIDLDIPDVPTKEPAEAALRYFFWPTEMGRTTDLLAVIKFDCPDWFEPLKRRLALNDLAWLDTSKPVNDIDDFDPWSKIVLLAYYRASAEMGVGFASYPAFTEQAERRLSQISD